MPIAKVRLEDGRIAKFEVPEGTTEQEVMDFAQQQFSKQGQEQQQIEKQNNYQKMVGDFGKGFGGSFKETATGLGQAGLEAGSSIAGMLGKPELQEMLAGGARDIAARQLSQREKSGAEELGNIAGTVAQIALPAKYATLGLRGISAAPKLAAAAPVIGDVASSAGLAAAQPIGEGESRLKEAGTGGALAGAGRGISSIAGRGISAASEPLVKAAEKYGIPLGLAQIGSAPTRTISKLAENLSLTAPRQRVQERFNKAIGKYLGVDTKRLNEDALSAIRNQFDEKFSEAAKYGVNDADRVRKAMLNVLSKNLKDMSETQRREVLSAAGDIKNLVRGKSISPEKTRNISKALRTKTYEATDDTSKRVIGEMSDAFEEGMAKSMPKEARKDLLDARKQYKAYKILQPMVDKNIGNVPPAQLLNKIVTEYGSPEKAGELGEIAKIGARYLKQSVPDSGTATNLAILSKLAGPVAGVAGTASGTFNPLAAAGLIAGGTAGSELMFSPLFRKAMTQSLRGVKSLQPEYMLPAEYIGGQ